MKKTIAILLLVLACSFNLRAQEIVMKSNRPRNDLRLEFAKNKTDYLMEATRHELLRSWMGSINSDEILGTAERLHILCSKERGYLKNPEVLKQCTGPTLLALKSTWKYIVKLAREKPDLALWNHIFLDKDGVIQGAFAWHLSETIQNLEKIKTFGKRPAKAKPQGTSR